MGHFIKIAEELGIENITDENIILGLWNEMGLLDGLNEEKQLHCALKFQEAAKYFILLDKEYDEYLEIAVFPIIRKLIQYNDFDLTKIKIETVIDEFNEYKHSDEWKNAEERLSKLDNIDMEAEYIYHLCEYINKKYNNYVTNE